MQAYIQYNRFYKELEKQIVTKREKPDNVWTRERRYWYSDEGIASDPRDPGNGAASERRRTHGQQTVVGGPSFEPRHTTRSHLGRDGDVERADLDPEVQVDPYTINTRDSLGADVDMMVTGVERERAGTLRPVDIPNDVADENVAQGRSSEQEKVIMVSYEGNYDPMDPHNWPILRKVWCTVLISLLSAVIAWSSTIDISALHSTTAQYHTSIEVQTVPTVLFLVGLGIGGLATAPISEVIGRNAVYISALITFMFFMIWAGLAKTLAQRIVFRGLAGLFASGLPVCSAAAVVDLWSLAERAYAFPAYAILSLMGAVVSIVPGSFISQAERIHPAMTWRWVDWASILFAGILLNLVILSMPETYSPQLLYWKATQLRRLTGDNRYRAPLEFRPVPFPARLRNALTRPFLLFWREPIIMVFAVYQTILFFVLFTFSAGFTYVFRKPNNLTLGQTGLTFLSLGVGFLWAGLLVPLSVKLTRRRIRIAERAGTYYVEPELSLYLAMFGAPLVPIALFWMGWTARADISIWCGLTGAVVLGCGVLCIFVSSLSYVASAFQYHPASALASLQLLRQAAAGGMAVAAHKMYTRLGPEFTSTLLGCVALVFLPVPYLLFQWGAKVRAMSRYARSEPG